MSMKNSNNTSWDRNSDLPICSTVPEPLCYLDPNISLYVLLLSTVIYQSHYRPEVPGSFQEVKVPRLRDNGPGWW